MSSLLQTKIWADFRATQGWSYNNIDGIFVLRRKLFLGKTFLYAPEVNFNAIANFDIFLENAIKIAKINQAIFLRLEILDESSEGISKQLDKLKEKGFIKAFEETQPEYRQIVDISGSEEEILAQMKEKGRYNIKIAQRKGVQIGTSANVDEFYRLFQETAKRNGFKIRPKNYFQILLDNLSDDGYAELLEAHFEGQVIAAEIVTYFRETATYLYGASGNESRDTMAPYLLHLEAMRRGKQRGCNYYDLLAVAPEGEKTDYRLQTTVEDRSSKTVVRGPKSVDHKYAGISRFKRQFGGRTVQIVGGYDLVFKPTWYRIFKIVEQFRRH